MNGEDEVDPFSHIYIERETFRHIEVKQFHDRQVITSTELSGENHLSRTPRCTTAGISLKSKGVVTWRNEPRNYKWDYLLLLHNDSCTTDFKSWKQVAVYDP